MSRKGYQGFGSFHSDNVEDLIRDDTWIPPVAPIDLEVDPSLPDLLLALKPPWMGHAMFGFGATARVVPVIRPPTDDRTPWPSVSGGGAA